MVLCLWYQPICYLVWDSVSEKKFFCFSLSNTYCINFNPTPAEPEYILSLQTEEANWSGSALFAIMWIYSNNPDQVIWLAEN